MAWDFETEPEFQRELDWMDRFVRDEAEPSAELLTGLGVFGFGVLRIRPLAVGHNLLSG
jgi:hypothetical protein